MDFSTILFLAAPFVMCIILAGIHCYLGLHVLARGVIFVDLSLAQVAALGATLSILFGHEHHSTDSYFFSLLCTFAAAGLFAYARKHEKYFSQEAVIGITYAFASAAVVLVVDRTAHGAEHIKDLLVGHVLWVTWGDVIRTSIIYGIVAIIHFVFRKQFLQSSYNENLNKRGFWDFLFYLLFGVIITSSVGFSGVLQVFAYLIVPSVIGNLFFKEIKSKLIFGWGLSILLSLLGLLGAHFFDFPAGAFMVVCFTVLPIILLLSFSIFKKLIVD